MNTDANETVVESSPTAAVETPVADGPQFVSVDDLNPRSEEYRKWQSTGELPAKQILPLSDESAPSKPGETTDPVADAKEAESGTAAKPKKDKPNQDRNWRALESRAEKAERELAELKAKAAPADEKKAESSPAPQAFNDLKAPERPARPALTEFNTIAEFDVAMDKYDASMSEFQAKSQAYQTAKEHADKRQSEIVEFNKKVEERWKGMVTKAEEKYSDFKTIALSDELAKQIPPNSPVDEWALQSDVGAEMLYHLGKHPEELQRILALGRPAQHRELAKLEDKLSEPEEKPAPKAKVVTDALPPPRDVGGRFTSAMDEEEAALKKDDVGAYMAIANAKELARRRAGHR